MNNEALIRRIVQAFAETPLTDAAPYEDPYCRFCESIWSGNGDDPIDHVQHEEGCLVLQARALWATMKEKQQEPA